jgi:hypothetical protein
LKRISMKLVSDIRFSRCRKVRNRLCYLDGAFGRRPFCEPRGLLSMENNLINRKYFLTVLEK